MRTKQGTGRAYTLERLERDYPELHQRVLDGELSANAAAIEAGFRKKETPHIKAIKAFRKMEMGERKELILAMLEEDHAMRCWLEDFIEDSRITD